MATPKLTTPARQARRGGCACAPAGRATPPHLAPARGFEHARRIATAIAAVWALTAAGAVLEPLLPGLAPRGRPHPTLEPTLAAGADILAGNLRVLAAPYLLAAFRWPETERTRTLGDVIIAAVVIENTLAVGLALGRFGDQLVPYLPQLPLEWAALAATLAAWRTARTGPRARVLVAYATATLALAASAAECEVLIAPHAPPDRHAAKQRPRHDTARGPLAPCESRRVAFQPGLCAGGGRLASRSHAPFPSPHGLGSARPPDRRHPTLVNHPIPTRRDPMNTVNLIGRLTADPELHDRSGTQIGRLRLAVQRPRTKDGEDRGADYIDITTFNTQAEVCHQYLTKGRKVAIEGHLHHSEWQAEDGTRRQKIEVVARNVEFLDTRTPDEDETPQTEEATA